MKFRLLAKIILTLLVLSAIFFLFKIGMADFMRLQPCADIEMIENGYASSDLTELFLDQQRLTRARAWDSENAIIPKYLGQTDFMLAQMTIHNPTVQARFLKMAIDDYQTAIVLQPYSAYLWAARMTAGGLLLDIDAKAGRVPDKYELAGIAIALHYAFMLDPWNPQILQQIVKVGVGHYDEFLLSDKLLIDEAVVRLKKL